jgi:hypothetical protein
MTVWVYCVFVLLCVYAAALQRADPPSKESYRLCIDEGSEKRPRSARATASWVSVCRENETLSLGPLEGVSLLFRRYHLGIFMSEHGLHKLPNFNKSHIRENPHFMFWGPFEGSLFLEGLARRTSTDTDRQFYSGELKVCKSINIYFFATTIFSHMHKLHEKVKKLRDYVTRRMT